MTLSNMSRYGSSTRCLSCKRKWEGVLKSIHQSTCGRFEILLMQKTSYFLASLFYRASTSTRYPCRFFWPKIEIFLGEHFLASHVLPRDPLDSFQGGSHSYRFLSTIRQSQDGGWYLSPRSDIALKVCAPESGSESRVSSKFMYRWDSNTPTACS